MKKEKEDYRLLGIARSEVKGIGEVFEIAKFNRGLTQKVALDFVEMKGLRLLTNKKGNIILMDDKLRKKYYDYFPLWTNTKVEIKGEHCKITELGKTVEKTIPTKNGWYEQDEFGLPFGKASSRDNPDARYLWRTKEYSGLVARGDDGFYGRRSFFAYYDIYGGRLGVLAVKKIIVRR
jgi:hypothetical protein